MDQTHEILLLSYSCGNNGSHVSLVPNHSSSLSSHSATSWWCGIHERFVQEEQTFLRSSTLNYSVAPNGFTVYPYVTQYRRKSIRYMMRDIYNCKSTIRLEKICSFECWNILKLRMCNCLRDLLSFMEELRGAEKAVNTSPDQSHLPDIKNQIGSIIIPNKND